MKSFSTLLLALLCLSLAPFASAQPGDLIAVDDSLCIMPGDSLLFNVTSNDVGNSSGFFNPVFLIGHSDCFGLRPDGELYWLPGADAGNCCGEHLLRYQYEICQPPNKCSAIIKIIVKCGKPDCFFVNLEDYFPPTDPTGGNPDQPNCVYACENSGAVYYVRHDTASTYTWAVTGGTFAQGNNPAEIIVSWGASGSGSISLTITDGNGATTVLEFCVDILEGPTAAFQASADTICLKSSVSFTNNSIGGNAFFWDFGDGNTSTMFQPTHQYLTPGTFTVTLIVTKDNYDADGNPLCCCSDTATAVIVVDSLCGPDILCISTLCAGDSSKYWTDATNCGSYIWTVLDENGSPWPFTGQGNDTICVQWGNGPVGTIVLEVAGCDSAYCDKPVSVQVPIISPTVGINGLTDVCENATATYTVPKWLSMVYNWQVSGGTILSGQGTNVIVVQWGTAPGPGIILLNYSSPFLGGLPGHTPEDCAGTANLTVQIKPAFNVVGPVPPVVCVNGTSVFVATPAPSPNYTWTITPPATFTGQGTNTIVVTWDAGPGNFAVTAVPNNPAAYCNQQVTKVVRVVEVPKPSGITGPAEICPGGTDTYFGQSAQSGTGFLWTVTGGTPASFTGNPLVVTWNASGPYSVVLQQFQIAPPGCASDTIRLNPTPKLPVGPLTISGPNACINTVQNYSAAPAQHPAAAYQWSVNPPSAGSIIGGQGSPNAQVQWNNTPGSATLELTVSLCNNTLMANLPVTLAPAPPPVITQIGILCPGVPATLDAGAGYTNYAWSTLDNTQTTSITLGGTYLVTVTTSDGCTAVGTYQAVPLAGPVASISTGNPTVLCANPPNNTGTVTISAITGPGYTFAWYRNGILQVLPSTQSTFTHTNTQTVANFVYWVVVTDANGCTKQSNSILVQQVTCSGLTCIPQVYTLSFTSSNPAPNCNTVNFTVSKTNNVTVTGWNFGDPGNNINSGTLPNAAHTYTKAGCFNVVVTAIVPSFIPAGSTCTVTRNAQVCVPLAADFSAVVNCQTVSFSDLSTYLVGQNPTSWQWDFGDLSTANVQNPSHAYSSGGSYTVTLTVMNAAGCTATISKTVVVPPPPTPTTGATPSPACVGQPVNFTGAGTGILLWLWNFGNGITNGSQNPAHTYLTPGTYNVSLSVTDNMGCTATATLPLTVHPAPPADTIAWSPSLTVCAGTPVTLTAPAGTGYTYLWSNNATTPAITVATSGTYSVVVTDANGCTFTSDSVTVTVLPLPSASISGPKFICDAGCVTLQATTGFGFTYQWLDHTNTPIGGATAATLSVCDGSLLPAYSVVVTDANGCSATSAPHPVALAVSPVFSIAIAPDPCAGKPITLSISPVQPDVLYAWSNGGTGTSTTVVQAGVYTAVGTDTLTGCKGAATATIHPLPDLCIVPVGCYKACDPDTICGPDGLAAYQWNLNGVPIPGATNQCLIVTQSGTYTLTGTTSFGCSSTSDSLMLMLVNCDCDALNVSSESLEDSCCWALSFDNSVNNLFGVQIHTADADFVFNLGSLDGSLTVFSLANNSIGLVNSLSGSPLPVGTLAGFLEFCFTNTTTNPQTVVFDWYDFNLKIVCSDTLRFDCPVEPDCLYLLDDSIYCEGREVVYTITVCNPIDADFAVAYIDLQPSSPVGVIVTPNTIDETSNPILPGECRTYTLLLSGPITPGQLFCHGITAHDAVPDEIDTTLCCMLDTMYCIEIPDCDPCDDIGVEAVSLLSEKDGRCCYSIALFNNYAAGYLDGVELCMLSPGTAMTLTNPFGSGWFTDFYSPLYIGLSAIPPMGTSMPLGVVSLPQICIQTNSAPAQLLEIKWMAGDSVECRDTVELGCEPPCGYLLEDEIGCDPATGLWVWTGTIKNTSSYTMGEAHFVFTSPAGMFPYNTTIPLGSLVPGGTQPFSLTLGPPALPGDQVCFTVSLHALNDNAAHTQCCNFNGCIALPECDPNEPRPDDGKMVLFPNPSNGQQVFARLTSLWKAEAQFRVFDVLGREVAFLRVPDAAGKQDLPLRLAGLGKGLYTVAAESGSRRWVVKMLVD